MFHMATYKYEMEEINLEFIVNAVNPFTDCHNENKRENIKSINKVPAELLQTCRVEGEDTILR